MLQYFLPSFSQKTPHLIILICTATLVFTFLELSAKSYPPRTIATVAGLGFIIYFIIDWGTKSYGGLRGSRGLLLDLAQLP
jgi:hypothetical protein